LKNQDYIKKKKEEFEHMKILLRAQYLGMNSLTEEEKILYYKIKAEKDKEMRRQKKLKKIQGKL
jgi:hypothetical protein